MSDSKSKISKFPALLFGCLFSVFLLAEIFPDRWWGIHFVNFLPSSFKYPLLLGVALCNIPGISNRITAALSNLRLNQFVDSVYGSIFLSIVMGLLYWCFPIAQDGYGEGFNYAPYLNQHVSEFPEHVWDWLFSYSLAPAAGRQTMLGLYTLFAYYTGSDFSTVFRLVDAIFGSLFILIWARALANFIPNKHWRFLLLITVVSAPFTLAFFGHIDTYSVIYFALLGWLLLLLKELNYKSKYGIWWLVIYFLLIVKLHPIMVLLAPALVLAVANQYFPNSNFKAKILRPSGIALFILLPIYVAGAILYFFVFKDYNDPRILIDIKDFDRLFLPIFSPEPPLDRYNLFSLNHFSDLLNAMLFWSPTLLFAVATLISGYRRSVNWRSPEILILGMTFLLLTSFLFAINPLISMPMDWDLFSFPAIVLLALLLAVVKQVSTETSPKNVLVPILALSMLSSMTFVVNANINLLSYRYESLGKWVYRSYYEHSAKYIHYGIGMIPKDADLYLRRKEAVIAELKPYSITGKDVKYASMYTDNGMLRWKAFGNLIAARSDFEKAHEYAPDYGINLQQLVAVNEQLADYKRAYKYSKQLVTIQFPTKEKALLTAINSAFNARLYPQCREHAIEYLKLNPNHREIKKLVNDLSTIQK